MALFLMFAASVARLFFWQILKGDELSIQARNQYQTNLVSTAPRGAILASDGSWLVNSVDSWNLFAYKPEIEADPSVISDSIVTILVDNEITQPEESDYLSEANRIKGILENNSSWVILKRKIDRDTKNKIESLSFKGLGFEQFELRNYPEASTAAHLLGFVGKDSEGTDTGYFGLEGYYNLVLSGKQGYVSRESDAFGAPLLFGRQRESDAIKGLNLLTHIDKGVQLMLDDKVKKGAERYGAAQVTAIIMEPGTGAVVAMSSYPKYDPNTYFEYKDTQFRNPAISESFEPGSVFKILVMAAGIDTGVVDADTQCDICHGPHRIGRYSIKTWDEKYYPNSSMTDVIVHSDNVGMVFVGRRLGIDRLYDYLNAFGIGRPTGIDLQGEISPSLREKKDWVDIDLATATFGQGVALTPIQLLKAVSAIANGGRMTTPQVVDKLESEDWHENIEPQFSEKVISEKAAKTVTAMMVEAAKSGEAKWTHVGGFKIAGKTGTAQIPIAGHYDKEKTIASFVGFAPADNPKFAMIVTLKEPSSSPWASETAAPLWYSIAKDLFLHYGILPEN